MTSVSLDEPIRQKRRLSCHAVLANVADLFGSNRRRSSYARVSAAVDARSLRPGVEDCGACEASEVGGVARHHRYGVDQRGGSDEGVAIRGSVG